MASLPVDAKTVVNIMDDEKGDVESKPKCDRILENLPFGHIYLVV